jgi:PAS domain S-box-containing protein
MTIPGQVRWPAAAALLVGVYVAGVGAVALRPEGNPVAAFWPAAGLAVALVALSPRRWWPALAAGLVVVVAAANVTGGRELPVSVLFGFSNAAEALVAGAILRRGGLVRPQLGAQEDFIRLVEATLLGGLTIALGASVSVWLTGTGSPVETWSAVFPSHAAATLVLVPLAMTGHDRDRIARRGELALQLLALVLVSAVVFAPQQSLPLTFMPLPFLVWAALRLGLRVVAWELAAFSLATTLLTTRGAGPFGVSYAAGGLGRGEVGALTQGYLLCAALMSLPLAIAVAQRRDLLRRVSGSELLFRRNFTESLVGMLLMRREGGRLEIFDLNDTAAAVLGVERERLLGRALDDVLETPERLTEISGRMLDGRIEGWKALTGVAARPGARANVALALLSGAPDPVFSAQLQDVTAEHDARARSEAAEKLTSATLDTAACVILVTDLEGRLVRVNAAATALSGYAEHELLGVPLWETALAPGGAPDAAAVFAWNDGPPERSVRESDAVTRTGETLRIVWNSSVVRDEQDRPAYAVMTGIDVTAERTAAGVMTHLMQAAITTVIIGTDTRGRITVFNSGAHHLLGHHPRDMVGRQFTDLLDPDELRERAGTDDPAAAFAAVTQGITAGATRARDWTWVSRTGQRHTISTTLSVAADAFAAQVGFLCIGRDVTEARQSQEMLVAALDKERTAVDRLRQLDEAKNEFVSTVSHELRTPVTSIVGYTEMLTDGSVVDPDPQQLPLLATIARNGQRLVLICNDLLLLSGLDSGAAQWEREAVELTALLDHVEQSLRPLLTGRDLKLELDPGDEPLVVLGDRAQLERVLLNLLSNAVKFTEDAGSIWCGLARDGDEACLVVQDDGIGIPEDEQSGLFQRFFRSSTAQSRAIQGTGLGLSIVAAIVAAHGGRITVDSAHLQGTTFTVRLPLRRSAAVRPG